MSDTRLGSPYVTIDPTVASAFMPELIFTPDFDEVGRWIGEQNSDDQARVLTTLYETVGDTQLAFIGADTAFDVVGDRQAIAQFYRDLAEHIAEGPQ